MSNIRMAASGSDGSLWLPIIFVLYVGALVVVVPTLTFFPGEQLRWPLVVPRSMWDSWEDWIRIASAAILHLIPFFMFISAIRAMSALNRERRYALRIAEASDAAVGKADEIVAISAKGAATRDDFIRLFGGDFAGGPPEATELFNELIQKSLSGRFEPTSTILSAYRETLSQDLSRLASAQRICLQGGVFFTFVGLGWGFSVAKFGTGTSLSNGNAIVDEMLGSLSLAFGTSIAGLLASITIILLAQIVRRRYIQTLLGFSVLIQAVFDLGRRLPQDKFFVSQLSDIANAVGGSTEATRVANDRLTRLTDTIGSGIQDLVSVRTGFETAVQSILEDQRKLGDSFRSYIDTLDPDKLRRQIALLIDQNNESVTKDLDRTSVALQGTTEALAKITAVLASMESHRSRVEPQVPTVRDRPEARRRRPIEDENRHIEVSDRDDGFAPHAADDFQEKPIRRPSMWRRITQATPFRRRDQ